VRLLMPTRTDNRQDRGTYGSVDAQIETALRGRSGLLSGHKKEILRPLKKGKVTIYGGLRADGTFWQPVSSAHSEAYTDTRTGCGSFMTPKESDVREAHNGTRTRDLHWCFCAALPAELGGHSRTRTPYHTGA
jgi:hypothetical protein